MNFKRFASVVALLSLIVFPVGYSFGGEHGAAHWGYAGEAGPEHWGDLSHEFTTCKDGRSQSPIDIAGAKEADSPGIEFSYSDAPLEILNNGHAIQANYADGSHITVNGEEFELLQFHFHGPSEDTVDGKHYDMQAHLVHKNKSGGLAVVGVFLTKGKENDFIKALWAHMPEEEGVKNSVPEVMINAKSLLPEDGTYYSFSGSLTTPPCTEGVKWMVMKQPVEVSEAQIKEFSSVIHMNARPTQPINDRVIKVGK